MKKFFSNLAGFVLIIAISLLGFITVTKNFLKVDNLQSLLKDIYHTSSSYNNYYFTTMINGSNTTEVYKQYFDEGEIEDLYTKFFAEYLLYVNGIVNGDKPEFNELKEAVDGYLADYEEGTGLEADRQGSFKFFYNLDQNMANIAYISKDVKNTIQFMSKPIVKDILIAIILICIVIIIILNRDISRILLHISTTFIANGIGLIIMKVLVDKYLSALVTDHFVNGIIGKLNSNLTRLSLICLLIGFVFLIAFFLYKILYRRKEKPQLVEMTTEALPQYEKPREEKIFFNNNQQPQIPKPEPFIPGKSGRKKHESAMSDDLIDLIVADNKNADIKEEEKK